MNAQSEPTASIQKPRSMLPAISLGRPRVWIGCLAAYNNGDLHGEWVNVIDADTLRADVARVLKTSPIPNAEEPFVADYDGFPSDIVSYFGEYPDFDELVTVADLIETHEADVVNAALDICRDVAEIESTIDDGYAGTWSCFQDYADDYVDSTGMLDGVADTIKSYFDYEAFARDLEMDYHVYESGTGTVIFHCT